jgi:hypothetical protein
MRNRFTNPSNGAFYDWQRNHDPRGEDELGKTRNIEHTAPTGNVGLVKQQGDDGPLVLRLSGTIVHRNQYQQFWQWYNLCRTQTIYFKDFDGQEYEVLITAFRPKRQGKLTSISPDPGMTQHRYTYTLEMEIVRVIAGDLAGLQI